MMGRCNCQAAMNQESLYYGGELGVGTAEPRSPNSRVILGAGWTGLESPSELSRALEGHPKQSRISALNLRRTQKASTAGGCQLTIPVLSSCPALRGICISCRPHPHLLGLPSPCMLMTSLWEMPTRSHCRISSNMFD